MEVTYFVTTYPNGDESLSTEKCAFCTLDAIEIALKQIKFCPIGTKVAFSDECSYVPDFFKYSGKYVLGAYRYELERVGKHGICISEYRDNNPVVIPENEILNHFRRVTNDVN